MYSLRTVLRNLTFILLAVQTGGLSAADDQTIKQALNALDEAWESRDYPHAVVVAREVVELLESSHHRHSINHAIAIHNLADAQQAAGQRWEARKSYESSIRLIERRNGPYASELPTVLNNLGVLYYRDADYGLATDAFRRAQHIAHRTDGVYTLTQLEFLDWLTMINLKQARIKDADRDQRFSYTINVRNYGEHDPRMLPAMNKLAEWYRFTGQLREAYKTYEKALFVIEEHALDEVEKLKPLRGISSVNYLKGICCGEEVLNEVLQIITRDSDSDHVDEVDALIHLADRQMIGKKSDVAVRYYRQVWDRLGADNPITRELFGEPALLGVSRIEDVHRAYFRTVEGRRPPDSTTYRFSNESDFTIGTRRDTTSSSVVGEPLSLCHSSVTELARTDDLDSYFVDVDFTVTREGGVSDVSLVDSNAPNRLQRYVTNTLRSSRYRPTFRDGEAVDTANVKLHQTFSLRQSKSEGDFNRVSEDHQRAVSVGCQLLAMRG